MLTVCIGLFLRITKTTNEDVPVGALLAMTLLCDLLLSLAIAMMLIDGLLLPVADLIVQGCCR